MTGRPATGLPTPRVSIGLPVRNGEPFLEQALKALLVQTCSDFELIVSDNASTDRTQDICIEHASRDRRLRYFRNDSNVGPTANFNRVLELASADYFMWAAHDDWWKPTYLQKCLEGFASDPAIVLVGSHVSLIDPVSGRVLAVDPGISTVGLPAAARFRQYKRTLSRPTHYGGIFYGVYRRDALMEAAPLRNVLATDHLLLAGLCLVGAFRTIEEVLFFKRWGGASLGFERTATVMGLTPPVNSALPWLWREHELQQIIGKSQLLSSVQKMQLRAWSWVDYLRVHGGALARTWRWVAFLRSHGGSRLRAMLSARLRRR